MSRNEAPRHSGRRATGCCGGLPVAPRVCRTAESSAEMMESSHRGRRSCAVLLKEAVAEKVRRRRGDKDQGAGARGVGPTWVPWCSRRAPAPLRARNKGGARWRRQDPGCRPRLTHPRTETRLRRALRSPTRARCPTSPPVPVEPPHAPFFPPPQGLM